MTKTHQSLSLLFALVLSLFSFGVEVNAQCVVNIHPTPQKMIKTGCTVDIPEFIQLNSTKRVNSINKEKLESLFTNHKSNSKFKITIGLLGDKEVKAYRKRIPDNKEGYFLRVGKDGVVVAANEQRGLYYGLLTLEQLLDDNKLPLLEIEDYPDIEFRGVVEGFYGTPWSFEKRMSQIKFYGDTKQNTYIYGPKDDPYHSSPNWRKPYPQDEAENIKQLVNQANRNNVNFVWAIHPGKDIKWNDEDRDQLLGKFQAMYDLGVRSFAVFFDDISGAGTIAQKQAELLNYIDNEFIQKKEGTTPLVMCPTEYNRGWTNIERGYLPTLGKLLNSSIHIMWTGDGVISEITDEGLAWVNEHLQRPAYIWWNFPVSDYVRDHMLVGKVYGNSQTIQNDMSGFVANPMEYAEASKIAIHQVADYTWNMAKFNSNPDNTNEAWEKAIQTVMPKNFNALYTFAKHSSDLGPNGHGFRREESVEIEPLIKSVLNSVELNKLSKENLTKLNKEFFEIVAATDQLLASNENPSLMEEIEPWVLQLRNVATTGLAANNLITGYFEKDNELFLNSFRHIGALKKLYYKNDQTFNQNPYQPGAKAGTLVLIPYIDAVYTQLADKYNTRENSNLVAEVNYCPHELNSDLSQVKNIALQVRTNRIILPRILEVINWNKDKSIGIVLDEVRETQQLQFNIKSDEPVEEWLLVETSTDGKDWDKIDYTSDKNRVNIKLNNKKAKHIRLINNKENKTVHMEGITLSIVL